MDETDFGDELEEGGENFDELDPDNPDDAFAVVERDYNKVYTELEDDPALSRYADEFNKLFDFLFKTHKREVELSELNEALDSTLREKEEILEKSTNVMTADAIKIVELSEEIDKSHRLIDNAHEREQAAQEIIDNLRKQIASLNAEIDFKNKMAQGDLEENPQVAKHREGLEREKAKLISEVTKITEKLNNALAYQEELEHRTSATDLKITEINAQLEETTADVDRYKRNKEKLELDLEESRTEVINKTSEIIAMQDTIQSNQRLINKYEIQIKDHTVAYSKCLKEVETWNIKYLKTMEDVDDLNYQNDVLKKSHQRALADVKIKDDERARLHIDIMKLTKTQEMAENIIKHMEKEKYDVVFDRNKLRELVSGMEREIDGSKRQADVDKRALENLFREKDILNKNLLRQQAVTRDHTKLIKIQEKAKRKLLLEIDGHVIEGRKQRKQISYLEKERDRLLEEELDLTKKIEDTLDEVKMSKNHIFDLKKTLAENENHLRMQQNLFDAVRADRNALQKSLHESCAENHELKNKLKTGNHQTEQLKEDIASKEQLLIKEENILRKMAKEKENMKIELNISWDTIRGLKVDIVKLKDEEKRLHKVIVTSDRTIRDQGKMITQLMNERDVLGSQLVRRNDELSLLYEKIKILQTTLHRGEAQYDQRLQDIKLLKVEIKRLRQEKSLLTKSINNMNDLKQEVFHLERDLTKERLKTKALEEELQNPMNVHRWRKLEGSDPDVYELLQKITLLQKRLLNSASEAIERERQLKEAEKLYMNLRQVVSRQPGPEMKAALVKTQKALNQNVNKMKCLVSELNLTEQQSNEHKVNLVKVSEELKLVKQKLMNEKRSRTKDIETIKELSNQAAQQDQQPIKFTGGGFRMSVSSFD